MLSCKCVVSLPNACFSISVAYSAPTLSGKSGPLIIVQPLREFAFIRARAVLAPELVGLLATATQGTVAAVYWTIVIDSQTANWQNIDDSQASSWALVDDSETAGWVVIDTVVG